MVGNNIKRARVLSVIVIRNIKYKKGEIVKVEIVWGHLWDKVIKALIKTLIDQFNKKTIIRMSITNLKSTFIKITKPFKTQTKIITTKWALI
jgi:hypothetical protein